MKCILCGQRKGKRHCPAKDTLICAQCCGEKRVIEIDCPESCPHLQAGRERESRQESLRHFRSSDPVEMERRLRVLETSGDVMAELQAIIATEREASRDLSDADVAEALDCLLKTLRTEDRGIIYETTSDRLRVETLRRILSAWIHSRRYPEDQSGRRLLLQDALECLEVLRAVVESHLKAGASSLSFVDFLIRNHPRRGRVGQAQPSIIIPGR